MLRIIIIRFKMMLGLIIYLVKFRNIWLLKAYLEKQAKPNDILLLFYDSLLSKSGSWIGYNSYFKGTPFFPHGLYGIFISGGAKLGKNVIIFQQVTIGSNTLNDSNNLGIPEIGDNVYIGAGAKIIGNICIGDNCRIGANAVVYKNLPPHSVAVQSPTRIITKKNLDNRYYSIRGSKWFFFDEGEWIEDKGKQINFYASQHKAGQ